MRIWIFRFIILLAIVNLIIYLVFPSFGPVTAISQGFLIVLLISALVIGWSSKRQGRRPVMSGLVLGLVYSGIANAHEVLRKTTATRSQAIAIIRGEHKAVTLARIHSIMSVGTHLYTRIGGYCLSVVLATLACLALAWISSLFVKSSQYETDV